MDPNHGADKQIIFHFGRMSRTVNEEREQALGRTKQGICLHMRATTLAVIIPSSVVTSASIIERNSEILCVAVFARSVTQRMPSRL